MQANQSAENQLLTLNESGSVPKTRVSTARQAQTIYNTWWWADQPRSRKRQEVKGLVDGNPPYRQADLKAAGRDDKTNINFRKAESYFNNAVGLFYDLTSEAPTYATIRLNAGTPEQQQEFSRKVTANFDWLCRYEPCFDYHTQISQDEMVLYGNGPLVFEDEWGVFPVSILSGQLKVPERTKSDNQLWEACSVEVDYLPDQLYSYIMNEKEARMVGWNVGRVKQAIINACPESQKGGMYLNWEWHQQQLKNGSLSYSYTSKIISVVHLFFREFRKPGEEQGRISQVTIIRDYNAQSSATDGDTFLFQKIGRYSNWNECVHPMYYDRGGGGFHHSVTGMGVKMYSPMALQNRMLCNLADKAFTPKVMFKPTTATSADEFSLQQFGDFAVLANGFDAMQTPISGVLEEGLVFNRDLDNLIGSNLSQYRSRAIDEQGNPPTATQVTKDAQQQASLQKTQMNRYYMQWDKLYAEMYRRAVASGKSSIPGQERAKEFVRRCLADGVPKEALDKVEFVKASRVVGQGSEFLRQQSTEMLFGTVLPMLPEDGRQHLIDDVIASRAGQTAVDRYNPKKDQNTLPDDQYATAMSQVADMKIGVNAVPTSTQNPVIFAGVFLEAMGQAVQSLQQGANPADVASFLDMAGKAVGVHIQRMAQDPSRKQIVKAMTDKLKEFGQVHDQLVEQIQSEAERQKEEQARMAQMQQAQQSEFALAKQKQDAELALKAQKTQAGIVDKNVKTRQSLALADAKAASGIRLQSIQAAHERRMSMIEMEHQKSMDKMMENGED